MKENEAQFPLDIPVHTLKKWQNIVNIMAELIGVPAALIMRILESDIEVFVSSQNDGNPYKPGEKEHLLGSGLYCETVIETKDKLLVPNALTDKQWQNNPDIKLNMISYLGFPITFADKKIFGTICVLDNKENSYTKTYETLILNFREIIQDELELIYMNHILGEKNKGLFDYLEEIKMLRGIVPICSFCKKIKNSDGKWESVETYVSKRSEAQFSHTYCPECVKKHYADLYKDN